MIRLGNHVKYQCQTTCQSRQLAEECLQPVRKAAGDLLQFVQVTAEILHHFEGIVGEVQGQGRGVKQKLGQAVVP